MNMTIGEALKKERKDLGLTQTEMAADVISPAHYSKIERDKHDISAYDLFAILTKHNISLLDFIKEIENTYQSISDNKININLKLIRAFYQSDPQAVKALNKEIQASTATQEEKMRAILIEANVTHTIDKIPEDVRKEIKRILFENDNWVDDELTLRLFCNSMLIFSHNELNFYINEIIDKYSTHFDQEDFHHQKLIASICVNFLYISCTNNDFELSSRMFSLLDQLPEMPEFFFYKVLRNYYKAIIDKDTSKSKAIKNFLAKNGLPHFSNTLPK